MSTNLASRAVGVPSESLRLGRKVVEEEAQALLNLAARLDDSFERAVDMLSSCSGCAIVTGMGKAGLVGQKIAATLGSTGTPSHFVHPAEALHGDLGRIRNDDVVLAFSYSGETDEVVRLAKEVGSRGVRVIAITGREASTLAATAETTILLGAMSEAGDLKLAPSTSSTAMLALGDALALVTSKRRGFRAEDFARHHPGGSLGRRLSSIDEVMRPLSQCRVAFDNDITRDVLVYAGKQGRRTGAIMLTDRDGRLTGIFTDSDLARLVENRQEQSLDLPVAEVMTREPTKLPTSALISDAIEAMTERKISELPVVDEWNRPKGIIDVTDLMSLLPSEDPEELAEVADEPNTIPFPKRA